MSDTNQTLEVHVSMSTKCFKLHTNLENTKVLKMKKKVGQNQNLKMFVQRQIHVLTLQ